MRRVVLLLATQGLCAIAACELAVDVTGLAGGTVVDDAAIDDTRRGLDDGADALRDAVADDGGRAPPFCETVPDASFCTTFDEGQLGFGWAGTTVTDGGSLVLDQAEFRSPPSALVAQSAASGAAGTRASLFRQFGASPIEVQCEFDVRPERFGEQTQIYTIGVYGPSSSFYQVMVNVTSTGAISVEQQSQDAGLFGFAQTNGSLLQGAWRRIAIDVGFAAGTVAVRVDGVVAYSGMLKSFQTAGAARMFLGLPYVTMPNDAWKIRFDNVACTSR